MRPGQIEGDVADRTSARLGMKQVQDVLLGRVEARFVAVVVSAFQKQRASSASKFCVARSVDRFSCM